MAATWMAAAWPLLVAFAVIFAPGLAFLAMIRIRGLALAALAPLASTALLGATAVVLQIIGVRWSVAAVAVALIAFVAVAFGFRLLCTQRATRPRPAWSSVWLVTVSVFVGGALSAWRLMSYIGDPDAIAQTNDAVFHLNAIRFILDTESASALTISQVVDASSFYPAAWHAIVSLVVLATGATISTAANVVSVAIAAAIWTTGIAWLARVLFASRPPIQRAAITATAAVLSGALASFPMLMFQWGTLYPNALSTALLPAAIACIAVIPAWRAQPSEWRSGWRGHFLTFALSGVVAVAIALAQPAGLLPWLMVGVIWLAGRLLVTHRAGAAWLRWVVVLSSGLALLIVWWRMSRLTSGSHWGHFRGRVEAISDVMLNGQMHSGYAYAVSVFMLVGLIALVRRREYWWVVVSWVAVSALYIAVAAIGNPFVRNVILGAWYADPYRFAALAPIFTIPIAAYGLVVTATWLTRLLWRDSQAHRATTASLLVATAIMVTTSVTPAPLHGFTGTAEHFTRYEIGSNTYLSVDERALLEELPDLVKPDARVLVNPSTGGGFGYLVSGVDVYPHTWSPPSADAWWVLAESLRDAASDSNVCGALADYGNPEYVLDFGLGQRGGGRYEMPGMTDFAGLSGFEQVARVGDASLWRISACPR